ncbi:hypothetical protein Asulf_00800 [Archaeoglobus sulfaticallidus PM70-1]|uniref:Carboxypeptidase regulatory-like domain-containing protein n=1 Tax=Archaeoglobus sulfaticallidus PM70-1 TaxID=387631 RepID=N0BKS1_9EURY|nr:carboxypeptidase-like regulatory domain-containing protein [Archaeoglobus sulfaticallidus]AGK60810.1 hypothetical protein Asulf_00800 [Archaeoglobus sulfaticallidus PM70-1]
MVKLTNYLVFGFLALTILVAPASAIGILKIDLPSRAMVGDEVEIKIIESLSGDPVEGVTVYINGVEIGTTDEDGKITYVFNSPGVYLIGASKFGYTPAASLSLSVEPREVETPGSETPTKTPTPEIPETEEYRGLVFRGDLIYELFGDKVFDSINIKDLEISDLIEKARDVKPTSPVAFFTDGNNYMILYGEIDVEKSGYYRIEGYSLGVDVEFEDKSWKLFEVTNIEKLNAENVEVVDLLNNPGNFAGKEIVVDGPFREVSFNVKSFGTPVCVGSISTLPVDFNEFVKELMDAGKKLQKEPDRETIEELTKFTGASTFRFERIVETGTTQAYWKALNAEITALVIPAYLVDLLFPDELREFISEKGVVLLIENVNIRAEVASIGDILANPRQYYGKVVEISGVYNIAKDLSVKNMVATMFPPAATSPVDVYFEPMATFESSLPVVNALLGFGITGFEHNYSSIGDVVSVDGKYTLKGVVLTASLLDNSLPSVPVLVVFERYRQNFEDHTIPVDQAEDAIRTFTLIKETIAGVNAEEGKTQYEKPEEPPITPTPTENTQISVPTATPILEETEKPAPTSKLESLSLSITPSKITAKPGETINLKLKVDWEPKDWKGKADVKVVLSAAGFKKEFELPGIVLENPPIETEFSYTLPENLPPLTYEAKIIVEAEDKKAESEVEVAVGLSQTPGFEVVIALISVAGGIALRGARK